MHAGTLHMVAVIHCSCCHQLLWQDAHVSHSPLFRITPGEHICHCMEAAAAAGALAGQCHAMLGNANCNAACIRAADTPLFMTTYIPALKPLLVHLLYIHRCINCTQLKPHWAATRSIWLLDSLRHTSLWLLLCKRHALQHALPRHAVPLTVMQAAAITMASQLLCCCRQLAHDDDNVYK
jgi:hypothetical protein